MYKDVCGAQSKNSPKMRSPLNRPPMAIVGSRKQATAGDNRTKSEGILCGWQPQKNDSRGQTTV